MYECMYWYIWKHAWMYVPGCTSIDPCMTRPCLIIKYGRIGQWVLPDRWMDGFVSLHFHPIHSFIHSFILAISIAPIASKGLAQDPYVAARTHDPLVESHRLNQCAIMSHTNAPPRSTIFGTHRLINTCKSISFAQWSTVYLHYDTACSLIIWPTCGL